jgi:maltooligosyltrehalose trehalohydrolase
VHLFDLWAPAARSVDLVLPGAGDGGSERRLPMTQRSGGWWALEVPGTGHGTDYAFILDGGPARPDPRSPWQPSGVHGPSRVFDPSRHSWSDGAWPGRDVRGSVLYELHVGTFTPEGTLDAAAQRLPHLVELGVDVVELMPVAAFDGHWGWGYDGVALYAVHEPYGGPVALQRFVDAAHAAGLAVCLDVVYNHLGPSGNYLEEFGPYFTEQHETPWGSAVNLDDEGMGPVRRWVCDNALRWLRDFHVDALRLDAVHSLVDESRWHLLEQLSDEVAALSVQVRRPLSLIAESDLNDPRMVEPTAEGGRGMTAQWDDDVHHALHAALTGERQGYYVDFGSLHTVARTLTRVFRHAGDYSTFRGKPWGHPVDPQRHHGHQFVVFLQNHDQIGNRATGDRISATLTPGQLAIGAALVLTSAFTPMLFMGEEWAAGTSWTYFTDFGDPQLGRAVSRGRREEFAGHGWAADDIPDPQDPATRQACVLDWAELEKPSHARLLTWYRDLIAARRAHPQLCDDDLREIHVEVGGTPAQRTAGTGWLRMQRGHLQVIANFGVDDVVVPVPAATQVVLVWGDAGLTGPGTLRLPGHTVTLVDTGQTSGSAQARGVRRAPGSATAGDGRIGAL